MATNWASFCEKADNVLEKTLDGRQVTLQQWCDEMSKKVSEIREILDNLPSAGTPEDCEYTKKLIDIIYALLGLGQE